jgi:16S rRNA (guanine527-N7)-methyltransferase
MTEAEARDALGVPRETLIRFEQFVELLTSENQKQNLVSASSLQHIWLRHILDSSQLLRFQTSDSASWLDLGSGAGFPGLVLAALRAGPVALVESRKLRCDFLQRGAALLGVDERTSILCAKLEAIPTSPFGVISARAFAPLPKLLELAERFATPHTVWILPKGKNAQTELDAAESLWQGDFRLERSLTDDEARIIVARDVRRKERGRKRR